MASLAEFDDLVRTTRENGCTDFTLLKCTSSYPATLKGMNLLSIPHMRELLGCKVRLPDHTFEIGAAVASVALGVLVIEKQSRCRERTAAWTAPFPWRWRKGHSSQLVSKCETVALALGHVRYEV